MNQTDIIASPKLRAAFFLGAVFMLGLEGLTRCVLSGGRQSSSAS
jgi:hypothetical protein